MSSVANLRTFVLIIVAGAVSSGASSAGRQLEPYTEQIEGTLVSFDMIPVPETDVALIDPQTGDERVVVRGGFWIGAVIGRPAPGLRPPSRGRGHS